jgi:hypothetical protein
VEFTKENMPKTKEDWNSLKEQDINLWSELTQENYDRTLREKRELETKYKETESQKNNLSVELEKYKKVTPSSGIIVPVITPEKPYAKDNLPKTNKEWEDLSVKDPVAFTDLRAYYISNVQEQEKSFYETRTKTQRTLQEEHPDMFEAELDENNQPKLDSNGKVVLRRAEDGSVFLSKTSKKAQLWDKLCNENPGIERHANAPELLQAQLERKLRLEGTEVVNQVKSERERMLQEGQVIAEGLTPPQSVKITFQNDEEKIHAQRMINKGLYRDFTEYVMNRDKKDSGIYDEGRMPQFGIKK